MGEICPSYADTILIIEELRFHTPAREEDIDFGRQEVSQQNYILSFLNIFFYSIFMPQKRSMHVMT